MRLTVAAVGKPRNAALSAAIHDYESRAARYWPLDVHEVREERAAGAGSDLVREREGQRLLEKTGVA
jgi:23S rRNA (pseudouridine1915-N3)-methyltransferase